MHGTRIGCAGWTIPRDVSARFDSEGSHLERYARVFNAVEINSSFYRPHQPATYERWAASVPDGFRFAVKLPRTITHDAKLRGIEPLLAQFAGEAGALGPKLGCVLVQLPPRLDLDAGAARDLFAALRSHFPCLLACEARHGSWFTEAASTLLREAGVARVIADPPAGEPGPYVATAETAYIRLHGSPRIYYTSYGPERLAQVHAYMALQKDAWCIFDNTASGAATANALDLQQLFR
ncbi:DUF72 domain-containing protein [Massilia endophytica]|uniref:DUF72 domain-containing protein n=1 Tax=Massilia endophytica TaxID=2899220 RepID=UPI001E4E0267|nr:DUF72 domain-containing protein [Massilia endophytica]UGQ48135.1 DUF72 domain-containing protein [Massilia endophytica]